MIDNYGIAITSFVNSAPEKVSKPHTGRACYARSNIYDVPQRKWFTTDYPCPDICTVTK